MTESIEPLSLMTGPFHCHCRESSFRCRHMGGCHEIGGHSLAYRCCQWISPGVSCAPSRFAEASSLPVRCSLLSAACRPRAGLSSSQSMSPCSNRYRIQQLLSRRNVHHPSSYHRPLPAPSHFRMEDHPSQEPLKAGLPIRKEVFVEFRHMGLARKRQYSMM